MKGQDSLEPEIAALEQQVITGGATRDTHYALAQAYDAQNQLAKAEQHYRATLAADPEFAPAYHDVAQLHLRQSRPAEAQRALVQYLQLAPTMEERHQTWYQLTGLVGAEPLVCEGCGRQSPIAEAFQFNGARLLCPRCLSQAQPTQGEQRRYHPLLLLGAFGGIALLTMPIGGAFHFVVANGVLLLLLLFGVAVLHESTHALAAWALGGTVFGIEIGSGLPIWQGMRFGTVITLCRDFIGGRCWFGFPDNAQILVRFFITFIAPAILHTVLGLLLFAPPTPNLLTTSYAPLPLFGLLNWLWLLLTLFPRRYELEGQHDYSDGSYLLLVLQGKINADAFHRSYYIRAVVAANHQKAFDRIVELCEAGLRPFPNDFFLLKERADALSALGRYGMARAQYHPLTTRRDLTQVERGKLKNNYAWALLLSDQPEAALVEARESYALVPWLYYVESTLGAALVETGDVASGLPLLLAADPMTTSPKNHASHFAHIAFAYAQLGNQAESHRYWEQAQHLDPENAVIRHIRPKLENMGY